MANRVLRDWTDSEKVRNISVYAERFFTRLIMKADDFGRFPADTSLLRANLFPYLLKEVTEAQISKWMNDCRVAGLIILYDANGKKYIEIQEFKQRLDRAKEKYPAPSGNARENSGGSPAETETESERKQKQNPKQETKVDVRNNVALTSAEILSLESEFVKDEVEWLYDKLSNYKLASGKKYKSDYGAINQWVKNALKEHKEKSFGKKESVKINQNNGNIADQQAKYGKKI
jgi:hypothetical protein